MGVLSQHASPSFVAGELREPFRSRGSSNIGRVKIPYLKHVLVWMQSELVSAKERTNLSWHQDLLDQLIEDSSKLMETGPEYRDTLLFGYLFSRALTIVSGIPRLVLFFNRFRVDVDTRRTGNLEKVSSVDEALDIPDLVREPIERLVLAAPRFIVLPMPKALLDGKGLSKFISLAALNIIQVGIVREFQSDPLYTQASFYLEELNHAEVIIKGQLSRWAPAGTPEAFRDINRVAFEICPIAPNWEDFVAWCGTRDGISAGLADHLESELRKLPASDRRSIESTLFNRWRVAGFDPFDLAFEALMRRGMTLNQGTARGRDVRPADVRRLTWIIDFFRSAVPKDKWDAFFPPEKLALVSS
jgi:hypothetical protein